MAVGWGGAITKTTNGGTNWIPELGGTSFDFISASYVDYENAWITGIYGSILKYNSGSGSDVSNDSCNLPSEFHLYQNYPNPFNPSTQIKLSVIGNAVM